MPGVFNVPSAGIKGASLDEVLDAAAGADLDKDILKSESANRLAGTALEMLAKTAKPYLLELKDKNGQSILRSNLQVDAMEKVMALLDQLEGTTKRKVLHKVRRYINKDMTDRAADRAKTQRILDGMRRAEAALDELVEMDKAGLKLERPTAPRLHDLRQAMRTGHAVSIHDARDGGIVPPEDVKEYERIFSAATIFIVEHDWAAAFKGVTDQHGAELGVSEVKLPAEFCAFEFRISGHSVIAIALELDGILYLQPMVQTAVGWTLLGYVRRRSDGGWESDRSDEAAIRADKMLSLIIDQVLAISVALDSEVAVTSTVRVDAKLNHARERRGQLPMFDYHVVSLAKRQRAAALLDDHVPTPGRKKRFHFRRGHWRHYQDHRTWIKWMLVGDPDLGFVDKHYRL